MLPKLLIVVIVWCTGLSAHAQLRAERKALRVFCRRILPNVNAGEFYPYHQAAPVCYDGTVAPHSIGGWWRHPTWYKDVRGRPQFHPLMADYSSYTRYKKRRRIKYRNMGRFYDLISDFDSATYVGVDGRHDLRQRDSLAVDTLPVRAALRRVPSATYQRALPLEGHSPPPYYLTVHRALVGRRYVLVGLVVACNATCYDPDNVPIMVLLHKHTLRLADWWYTIEKLGRD
jgi:hypothetical protein